MGIALALSAVTLAACSYDSADAGVQSAGSTSAAGYSYDGDFRMIPAPRRLWESPLAIAQHFLGGHPEGSEGRPELEIRMAKNAASQLQLWMTAMGYLDDSVRGEQWRLTISHAGSGWGVSQAENRFMCQRGPNAGQWVTSPCP